MGIDFIDLPPLITRERLLAEKDTLRVLLSPDVAPKGTEGWVYRVVKVNPRTVKLAPLQGGTGVTTDPLLLVEASADQVAAAQATPKALEIAVGAVVRLAGPRWPHPAEHLYVVTATKSLTEVSVARLGGDGGRYFAGLPRTLVAQVVPPDAMAAALGEDPAFA